MKNSKPSLIRRAMVIFIFTIFVSGALGGYLVNYYSKQFLQDISERNFDLAHHVKEGVKIFLEHHAAELFELRLLVDSYSVHEIGLIREELDRINAFHPLLEQVQILDQGGSIVQVSPFNEEYIGMDMSAHEGFKNALKLSGNDVFWSDSFVSTQTNDPAVTMSLPIKKGVLMAHLNLKELSDLVGFNQPVAGEVTSITDRRGVVIAHPSQVVVQQRMNWMNLESIHSGTAGRVGTYREVRDGIVGLASVISLEGSGWVVNVFQPEKVALGVLFHARRVVAIAFILLLILTMLTFLTLQHQGMKPIRRLEEKADMIAAGHYGEDLDAEFRELSGFVNSFNEMTGAVRTREEELRSSEERFRILFDEAAEPVYLMDGQGNLLTANKRACQSLGYSPLEFTQMNVSQFIVGQDRAMVSNRLGVIAVGESVTVEGEHQRKDGTVFPVEVRIARMRANGEDRYIAHARDISVRKKAEAALIASEEKYRLLADNAIDVIWTMDLKLKYQYFSPSITQFRGVTVEKAISQTIEDAMTPDSINLIKRVLGEELEKEKEPGTDPGRSRTFEIQFIHSDGSFVWGEVTCAFLRDQDGEIIGIQGVTRDISERKIAEEALRNSEERYRRLFDQNPMPMWLFDTETLEILAANESAVDHYGYTKKELLGMTIRDIRPQDEIPRLEKFVAEAGPGRERAGIWKHRKKDGTIILVEIFTHDTVIDNRHCRLALVNDLTDKLGAEDALRESEERLKKISEGVFEGIVITEKGIVIESNNQIADMLGYDPNELLGKSVMEFVAPEWRDFVLEKIKTGFEDRYEHESVRKDGSYINTEIQGTNTTYQGKAVRVTSIRDITDQKRAENVLKEREKRYRLLYDNNPLSYQSLSEEGMLHEVNTAWLQMTGYEIDNVIGKRFIDFVSDDYKDVVRKNFPILLAKGELQVPDLELVTSDGQTIHVTLFGRASLDEETGQMKTHCLLHDITERTMMEQALKKGAQLAAVGQVASGIAHEINNPLATISASTEALLARLPTLSKETGRKKTTVSTLNLFHDYLMMIMDEVNRSSQIIRDLLDFTRVRDYVFARTDIAELVSSTVPLLSIQSRMIKHNFEVDTAPDLPDVRGDRDRLRQVLIILLTNAVESMPEGGNIIIKCSLNKRQKTVALSIKDSGTGIKKESQQRIFEPFYTTKDSGSGTGLGLSIADTIITKHGGHIELKANRGKGSTFVLILPLYDPSVDDKTEGKLH